VFLFVVFRLSFLSSGHTMTNQYRRSTTIPGSLGTEYSSLDDARLRPALRGVMVKAHFTPLLRPHIYYRHLDHSQPRPTSRWSMMLVGCQQSGALATPSAKSKSWIRVQHVNMLSNLDSCSCKQTKELTSNIEIETGNKRYSEAKDCYTDSNGMHWG